ncbi:hypothetical protein V7056_20640 [Bacillus sp. JJ664]
MRLYQNFDYTLNKHDKMELIFENIEKVLIKNRKQDKHNYFFFSDFTLKGHVSSVQRIVKKFPELAKFEIELEQDYAGEILKYKALTNLPSNFSYYDHRYYKADVFDNVSFEVLKEIAYGIPRSFPCHKALFLFSGIDWSYKNEEETLDGNSVMLINDWWTPKRSILLKAKVSMEVPDEKCSKLKSLPKEIEEAISSIGRIKRNSLECVFSLEEKRKIDEIYEKCKQLLDTKYKRSEILDLISFPFDLSEEKFSTGAFNIPRKKTISKIVKKLGYNHLPKEGSSGFLVYGKLTENNNRIILEFDSGSTFYNLRCNVIIQGPGWEHSFMELPCIKNSYGDFFPISDENSLEKVVSNFGVVVDLLENKCFIDLEKLHGPAPKWFQY